MTQKTQNFARAILGGRADEIDTALQASLRESGFGKGKSGTATVASGATTVTVTHGLGGTPNLSDISVTPTNDLGTAAKFWISGATATQFTINVNAAPGGSGATFVWSAHLR